MVPQIIPGHITALYVFACINLMALFHITLVEADITVLNSHNETEAQYLDLPARFGPAFPEEGLYGRVKYCETTSDCKSIYPLPDADPNVRWIALLQRNGCHFDEMVYSAQKAGYVAVIVYNNDSNNLIPMGGGKESSEILIPSCFVGEQDGKNLRNILPESKWSVIIDNRVPFNYNLYLLPFAIVVGICFLLMLIFMIAKWVRDFRKRRRARLSREHLKKLPTKKFKKGDPYDMCAICLDEYEEGDKLRILPCSHAYHMKCVDPWLTKNKRNCPVCKRKVIPGDEEDSDSELESDDDHDAPSETTPLLTAQTAGQLGVNNSAFQSSGAVSEANSVSPEDVPTADDDSEDGGRDDPPTPSTSAVEVHTPSAVTRPRGSGYGSLSRSPSHRHHDNDDNPEFRGAVGGVGAYLPDDTEDEATSGGRGRRGPARREAELRGIVSSDPDEDEEEGDADPDDQQNTSLRVKIISLFKSRGGRRQRRRRHSHEDA